MLFDAPTRRGTLLRRYKRFLADIRLDDGEVVTAHVANTGPMTGCAQPGSDVLLTHHPGKGRKLPYSWELIRIGDTWALVNTARPNHVVREAIEAGRVQELSGYATVRPEVRWGRSRIDMRLADHPDDPRDCWVEVKNVTLRQGDAALFPDTVTTRGARHMAELADIARAGHRAAVFFLVSRTDCVYFAPADAIDPTYASALRAAVAAGVEVVCYGTRVNETEVVVTVPVPVRL